jgi:hypothetical protein
MSADSSDLRRPAEPFSPEFHHRQDHSANASLDRLEHNLATVDSERRPPGSQRVYGAGSFLSKNVFASRVTRTGRVS